LVIGRFDDNRSGLIYVASPALDASRRKPFREVFRGIVNRRQDKDSIAADVSPFAVEFCRRNAVSKTGYCLELRCDAFSRVVDKKFFALKADLGSAIVEIGDVQILIWDYYSSGRIDKTPFSILLIGEQAFMKDIKVYRLGIE